MVRPIDVSPMRVAKKEMMISVIILTFNDEVQIRNCLASIASLTDDVIVVDSFSTDRTVEFCKEYGAKVFQHEFVNQALQFNWALDHLEPRYDWVLRLDSDEIVPPGLCKEIRRRVGQESYSGYFLNRRIYWMNHWLKHGRMYPHYILRLFRNGCARYEERTEEHLILEGEAGYFRNDFLEDNRKNTLDYFTEKHLATARGEVEEILAEAPQGKEIEPRLWGPKVSRTRWLKLNIYNRAPLFLRGLLYFSYRYFLCLGFLDGKPGLIFHFLQGFWYRFYIDSKVYEAQSKWQQKKADYKNI